jgi:hypothetical protein
MMIVRATLVPKVVRKMIVMSARKALQNAFVLSRRKICDWNWTPTDNSPIIFPINTYSGVCADLLKKYESQPPSELRIFLEYMDPLFVKICEEPNANATNQLNNADRKKLKDDDKWFETTQDEMRAYIALVILMSQVLKSRIQLYWSKNRCFQYYACTISDKNIYWLFS